MRATVNYETVAKMVRERLFPEPQTRWGTYPRFSQAGNIIFDGHAPTKEDPEKAISFIRCCITPEGSMVCKNLAHAQWLAGQALEHGLPLDMVVIPPPTPQAKKVKVSKGTEKASKPSFEHKKAEKPPKAPGTDKPAMSLRDILNAKKAKQKV